ncbi:MAG TPA: dihydrodipicolinate synthase family protein [Candidatus Paceibacterota bacterium]|nr:dihydrodipicolinate synthase family protein [Candidatus Paceibacterota bacterium]HRZ53920.1 dihydrodipicolinate synthase family protein [Candidatus Paceibacterota bacterium]
MNTTTKPGGVVVPLVTPIGTDGQLDCAALDRLIEFQIAGGVEGLLLLGTTGEGPCVPRPLRRPFIERAVATARKRLRVYVNVTENSLADALAGAKDCFSLGADAIAALPPFYFPPRPAELTAWFRALLDASPGPVLLYNIPMTTRVSIPLELIGELAGHPRFVGLKDSENDAQRHADLLRHFGGRADFSLFCGVGALMAQDLKSGMDGIVPSVGNLIPDVCHRLCAATRSGDWTTAVQHADRMNAVAALYQKGRTLGQSLAAIKSVLHLRGLCSPAVFPPLLPLDADEVEALHGEAAKLYLA